MEEKKVLVITYYWPPSGGSGVQRWLKFVKYLPQFGYTPYVFTPQNPSFPVRDETLLRDVPPEAEIIHFPIWEPYEAFFRIKGAFGKKESTDEKRIASPGGKGLLQRVATAVRANLLIPDPRVFWIRPSVRFLSDFLKEKGIKTVITTGPPHSVHLIGYQLRKKNAGLKWIADFRDPWSEWGFLDSLGVSGWARSIHRLLEKKVLATADVIVTITPFYKRRFEALSGKPVTLLTNGYDEDDFTELRPFKAEKFVIRHVGIVNEKCDPRPFMLAVREVVDTNPEMRDTLRVDFTGDVHPDFCAFVLNDPVLSQVTVFTKTVSHKELILLYNSTAMLLLVLTGYRDAEGYMPGKLFEYLATGLPVLGIGPETGDAATLMKRTVSGEMIETGQHARIVQFLNQAFLDWKSADPANRPPAPSGVSRRDVTAQLVDLLDKY